VERRALLRIGVAMIVAGAVGWRALPLRDSKLSADSSDASAKGLSDAQTDPATAGDRARDGEATVSREPDSAPAPDPVTDPDRTPDPDPEPAPQHEHEPEPEPAPAPEAAPQHESQPLRVEVICREALGLAAPVGVGVIHTIDRMMLHHTAVALGDNALAPQRLRGHQRYHQQQGWPDIAYHYGVDLRGNLYELRTPDWAGDTFTEYDPAGHLLVVCEGDYDREQPTDAMLQATAEILAYGATVHGADPQRLTGHRDLAATTCPGDHLYARLDELRVEVLRLATAPLTLDLVCGAQAQARLASIEGA